MSSAIKFDSLPAPVRELVTNVFNNESHSGFSDQEQKEVAEWVQKVSDGLGTDGSKLSVGSFGVYIVFEKLTETH